MLLWLQPSGCFADLHTQETAESLTVMLTDGIKEAGLTSEVGPSSLVLPSEPPAREDCSEAVWFVGAALHRHHLENCLGKILTISQRTALESGGQKNCFIYVLFNFIMDD